MNFNLHVEQLIFEGLHLSQRERMDLATAFKQELGHLLEDTAWRPDQFVQVGGAVLEANQIEFHPRLDPQDLGRKLAQSVFAGVSKRVRPPTHERAGDIGGLRSLDRPQPQPVERKDGRERMERAL